MELTDLNICEHKRGATEKGKVRKLMMREHARARAQPHTQTRARMRERERERVETNDNRIKQLYFPNSYSHYLPRRILSRYLPTKLIFSGYLISRPPHIKCLISLGRHLGTVHTWLSPFHLQQHSVHSNCLMCVLYWLF